ncbi:hypothetical protein EHS25_006128 [Saitozyma podzolica]|uniref:Transmembrane protein 188 n=1 Tax=Saitozyma podzolica TaxID=1890683 RepID=A0A427XTS0_9TREE|nr:hypothetical protein EHS25_006128 [Saitozyma podzolica]
MSLAPSRSPSQSSTSPPHLVSPTPTRSANSPLHTSAATPDMALPPTLRPGMSAGSSPSPPNPGTSGSPSPRPDPRAPFHPPADTSTYRDLLLFEERLKMNAEMLRRRRRRYSTPRTVALCSPLAVRRSQPSLPLVLCPRHGRHGTPTRPGAPQTLLLLRALQGSLAVVLITLALFFASGMYEEKVRYARSYITHSNKALRPLNMHLNMRRARPSLLAYLPAALRPSLPPVVPPKAVGLGKGAGPGPGLSTRRPSTTVMAQIPPSSNPRGELIFSSRVDRAFREGYERYRAAFERRREERAREGKVQWWWRRGTPTPPASRRGTPPPTPVPNVAGGTGGGTPGTGMGMGGNSRGSGVGASVGSSRARTPSPASIKGKLAAEDKGRDRAESYSFVPSGPR